MAAGNPRRPLPTDPVGDDEVLYHAVYEHDFHPDAETGEVTIGEDSFSDRNKQPSVNRALIDDWEPQRVRFRESDAVVSLVARDIRAITSITQKVPGQAERVPYTFDVVPRPEDNNPAHAQIEADRQLTSTPSDNLKMALAQMSQESIELYPYEQVVYLARSGRAYHRRECRYVQNQRTPTAFRKLKPGLRACRLCNPVGWALREEPP
jgi:hypothetical protein